MNGRALNFSNTSASLFHIAEHPVDIEIFKDNGRRKQAWKTVFFLRFSLEVTIYLISFIL